MQDFTFGKYLGNLKLRFDDYGDLISYNGNPILLDGSYAQNPALLKKIEGMSGAVRNFYKVGSLNRIILMYTVVTFLRGTRQRKKISERQLN